MADELERQAHNAFVDEEFELAVSLYSKAISALSADPSRSASLLVSRAQAHIRLNSFTDAVADANRAIEIDPNNPKAYLRKGVACFHLDEYETAKAAFTQGAKIEASNPSFKTWIEKCDAAIAKEAASFHSETAEEKPSVSGAADSVMVDTATFATTEAPETTVSLTKSALNYRTATYQNVHEMVVEIFAKRLKEEEVKIEFGLQLLKVTIDIPPNEPYIFQKRLNQKVIVEKCKYHILGTKIEIRLAKAEPVQWKSLEYDQNQTVVQTLAVQSETKLEYPSSSKKGHKDWDKLEAEVKKEEKDEKLEGDAALNKLFRDIYQNADEDTRRAMNKSFLESNGTVLSTNWKEVGSKKIEGSPPSGMEMKKWEI